jgi:putative ABC transport system permease protein
MILARLLTLRSLRTRPLRLALSLFGIILGVAAILAISITNQTAMMSVSRVFEDTSGKANLIVTSQDVDSRGFDDRNLRQLEAFSGIAAAVPSVHVQTVLAEDAAPSQVGMSFFGMQPGGLTLYGIDPQRDQLVRSYTLAAGSFLSPEPDAAEIVLVDSFADENDLEIGEEVEINTEAGLEQLRLVGLMAKEGPGQLNNGAFGVIPLSTAQKLFYREGKLSQVDLVAAAEFSGTEGLETLRLSLQSFLGGEYSVVYPASQGQRMTQMLGSYQIGLNFLSGMALFVGAFLIYNTFSMTVVERTREFGMLRTIGMSRSQVTRQVLIEAVILGILGTVLGIGMGLLLARGLTGVMELILGLTLTDIAVPMDAVLTSMVVGLVVSLLAAAIPAWQAGRISPLEALRVRASTREGCLIRFGWIFGSALLLISTVVLVVNPFPYDVQFRMGSMVVVTLFLGGTLLIPSTVSIWERIFRPVMRLVYGSIGRLGSSNIQRSRLRTTLTVAALMIGVAMMIVVWAMTDSFKGDLDQWLKAYIGGDLYVTSSLPMGKDIWKKLQVVPGVEAATPVRYFDVDWVTPASEEERISFMAFDPASYNQVTSFIFSQAMPDAAGSLQAVAAGGQVLISSVIAEKYGLEAGDQITLLTKVGPRQFGVAGVVVDYFNQGMVISGSWSDMERNFRQRDANAFLIKIAPGLDRDAMRQRIDDLYGKRERLIIETNQDILGKVTVLMQQAFRMFDVLALIAMMVGFFGIINTLTMNVIERTQEIGMLRGVGMTRGQVVRMILAEAALIGVIGGVLGLAFGIILARIFMLAMTAMSGYSLTFLLPLQRIILAVVMAFLVSQVAASLPAARAARIRILDAIQYE